MAFLVAMREEIEGTFDLGRWTAAGDAPFDVYAYQDEGDGARGVLGSAVIVHTGIGTTNAAAAAQFALDRFTPRRVVNLGLVGCLDTRIPIGTVHSVSTCAFFDVDATVFGYRIGQIPRTSVHQYDLASLVAGVPSARLISGDTFVTDSGTFHPDFAEFAPALVDMELAAIAHTLYRNSALGRLESYKAPSDYCNDASTGAFEANMPRALAALAVAADEVLRDACGVGAGVGAAAGVGSGSGAVDGEVAGA